MENRALSIHAHFYQPAREDPLTGEIPIEPGAHPYENWNERIYQHCYKPNAELRNFERISFNIGPTLMDWMDRFHPETVVQIIEQENSNYQKYGVGNALAQPFHHTILPLATYEDKVTQISWGITDFTKRFGHAPVGMWLPETAVDLESLRIMVDHGIEFTILAPWQAVDPNLDVTQPYYVELGQGKKIVVFFYHREISTQLSFDPFSTTNADQFAAMSVMSIFNSIDPSSPPRILLAASDGELYGHHQPFRDKFLDHLLNGSLSRQNVRYTYPGLWLRKFPPQKSIQIYESTSWSCHHGIMRWSNGCSCTPDSDWKSYLKSATDQVAKTFDHYFNLAIQSWHQDPLEIREKYGQVISHIKTEEDFLQEQFPDLAVKDRVKVKSLLWALIDRQRMYTSCGWFFEDLDRIEPKNVIAYAAQSVFWMESAIGVSLFPEVSPAFARVKSKRKKLNGLEVFSKAYQRATLVPDISLEKIK